MTPRRKWNTFKVSLRDFFFSEDEDGIQSDLRRRRDFIQNITNNAIYVRGENNTVVRQDGQGDRYIVTQIMSLLSKHIIPGAAHDSSARDPPPRCHPDTRVKLVDRITAWFEGQAPLELLLWITGPAGVGKSAVVQTFAEHLVKCGQLGASVFISRPNKRDNPHGVFITIAYQLATRIEAYRNYIVERLGLDPELLNGDLQAQFTTFIVEPFAVKHLGAGGKRWGILLDGLDELRGTDAQCEIIHLVGAFMKEHSNVPLVWIIASRPESHISNTFEDDELRISYWSEYIPIDSTEACEDVERFLRSNFKTVRKKFRHCVSSDWPSNTDFLKLTAAASGLFIYAEVVMQFIRDSGHADPVSRFEVLLSVIDRSNAIPSQENPFVHLDALYHEILSSMPPTVWPTTKRLLGVAIYGGQAILGWRNNYLRQNVLTLRGTSILFGISRNAVYASLDKLRSTLKIPDWKVAHKKPLTFLHASFADYLKDSKRAGGFHVGSEGTTQGMMSRLLEIWNKCSGDDIGTVEAVWHQYCLDLTHESPSRGIEEFYIKLFHDSGPTESPAYTLLWKMNMRKLCYFLNVGDLMYLAHSIKRIPADPRYVGFLRKVQLKDLVFGHLDWNEMSPAYAHYGKKGKLSGKTWVIHRPRSSAELTTFVSDLLSLQERSPELRAFILGGIPKERVVVFQRPLNEKPVIQADFMYYVIPYPE
ncbi:hypothetical protein AGABI1DRAFT_129700 [Agaricus bisporus var. burnettii JB137-S8]|uniref:Nephrocystin 3-like N-terminal domain-containing protein n=1 Tax=Agaricus bisporus var. burnettii (strain JB137-S8 / ATCC MYA-4627 / FGSC 10392) TaxID=597362 RepID=K5XSH7_AGABU|nr:uncharacterized protein AGABI1DRAFT_129700 [Agaricus bisporus var. burnettii JB137-S8]EKM77910.1 hypothetical protein AGABI1DRAFT_129700 [Agaricus bisporus var. burnettii JB137-S8]